MAKVFLSKQQIMRGGIREVEIPDIHALPDVGEHGANGSESESVAVVCLKQLPTDVVIHFQQEIADASGDTTKQLGIMLQAVAQALCDKEGNVIFSIEEAGEIPFPIFTHLQPIVLDMLGLRKEEPSDNPLSGSPSGDSPTDSPSN